MQLVVFENNKPYVIDEFLAGRFDYIELASDVAETKFFEYLMSQEIVQQLAQSYPTPRCREHVPLWMYVCSQLSLRLHGKQSFHSYPLIIRSGGLIDALGPEVARREIDPATGNMTLSCAGFNERNFYDRQTPCDQDFLRKLARDTEPEELEKWYNEQVAVLYKNLGAYDSDGIFMADGTYLFVPDNPKYAGSQRLLFDEHNHPVSQDEERQMTKAQRQRCRWRRCYKAVLLLHCDEAGERFVVCGVRVLRDKETEGAALWPLIDRFVGAVGAGVIKILLVDRGFIDGPQIGRMKTEYAIDTVIPIRSNMNLREDVEGLKRNYTHWEEYQAEHRPPLPDVTAASHGQPTHPDVAQRERQRRATLARQAQESPAPPRDPSKIHERTLLGRFEKLTSWWDCPVPLTGVYSREIYADGHEQNWLLATTSDCLPTRRVRQLYGLRTDIEERHRQVKCFWDLTRFHSTYWNLIVSQTVFVCLTYSLLQIHLLRQGHEALNRRTWPTSHRLLPDGERVIVYRQQYFAFFSLLEHMELTLRLEGKAKRRALAKTRQLRHEPPLPEPPDAAPDPAPAPELEAPAAPATPSAYV